MKKSILWITAVVVTAFVLSVSTIAQPGGGQGRGQGPGGGMGPGMGMGMGMGGMGGMGPGGGMMGGAGFNPGTILQNEEFVKMLELTPAQRTELPTVMQTAVQGAMQKLRDDGLLAPPTPGEAPNPTEMLRRMELIQNTFQDAVQEGSRKVLNPAQQTKAQETMFQLSGGLESPMLNERGLDFVNLSDEQKEQIRKIAQERNAENLRVMQGFFDGTRDPRNMSQEDREKIRTEAEARNKQFSEKITALLTPEQRAKAQKLTEEAPAVREKLGIPAPGQPGQRVGQQRGGQQQGFVPGEGSWRPGQGGNAPNRGEEPRRGNFPPQRQAN